MINLSNLKESPKKVALPPVGLAIVVVLIDEELPGLLPEQQEHGETETRNTENEEVEWPASED